MTMPSLNETMTENYVLRKELVQQVKERWRISTCKPTWNYALPPNPIQSNFKKRLIILNLSLSFFFFKHMHLQNSPKGSEVFLRILFAAFSLSRGWAWLAFSRDPAADQGCVWYPWLSWTPCLHWWPLPLTGNTGGCPCLLPKEQNSFLKSYFYTISKYMTLLWLSCHIFIFIKIQYVS